MNYHNITHDDQNNGLGLRVVLWCSFCEHHCKGCHNPQTWDKNSGIPFDEEAKQEIFEQLKKTYISGLTLSGGDPLNNANVPTLLNLVREIKEKYSNKNIWIYSGFTWEELNDSQKELVSMCDVFVDGKFVQELASVSYHWAGSTNQRVIDIPKTIANQRIVLLED